MYFRETSSSLNWNSLLKLNQLNANFFFVLCFVKIVPNFEINNSRRKIMLFDMLLLYTTSNFLGITFSNFIQCFGYMDTIVDGQKPLDWKNRKMHTVRPKANPLLLLRKFSISLKWKDGASKHTGLRLVYSESSLHLHCLYVCVKKKVATVLRVHQKYYAHGVLCTIL